jgi:hypothetical protein
MHIPTLPTHVTGGSPSRSPANLARVQISTESDTPFGKLVSEIAHGLPASHGPNASPPSAADDDGIQPQDPQVQAF